LGSDGDERVVESTVEEAMLAGFGERGYEVAFGPDVAPEKPAAERERVQ